MPGGAKESIGTEEFTDAPDRLVSLLFRSRPVRPRRDGMTAGGTHPLVEIARRAALRSEHGDLPDDTLLREFVTRRDEAAFAALVRRHGPMVLGICRRALRNAHDADDAFQATFLVLALKAASIERPGHLACWLHGVAYRTALAAKAAAVRRRKKEAAVSHATEPAVSDPEPLDDLRALLDRAVAGLPDKYRRAILLCDHEGRSRKEAARLLGIAEGTLSSRLAAGRRLLASRLAKHGARLSAATLAVVLTADANASLPAERVAAAATAAVRLANGAAVAVVATASVGSLTREVSSAMALNRLKTSALALALVVLSAITLVSFGQVVPPPLPGGGFGGGLRAKEPPAEKPADAAKKFPHTWAHSKAYVKRDGDKGLTVRAEIPMFGIVKLLDADGKAVSLQRFQPWQPPAFTVTLKEVRVYDARGKERAEAEWSKLLADETLVLIEFSDKVDPKSFAHAYQLYRDDVLVLLLPPAEAAKLDVAKAFDPPVKSLPQVFPGAVPPRGGPVPPPPTPGAK